MYADMTQRKNISTLSHAPCGALLLCVPEAVSHPKALLACTRRVLYVVCVLQTQLLLLQVSSLQTV